MPDFFQTLFGKSRDSVANDLINQANPGTSQPSYGVFDSFIGKTKINQIRGINQNNATGSGIPKHVTNVNVRVNNAQKGATCAVTVMFQRDPSDSSFSGVNIYVSGYQGNSNPTQVAAGSTSPITFTLNNTGENVSFLVQAFGNSGNAPLSGSPSRGTTLPKSSTGGYGTNTTVAYNASNPPASLPTGAPLDSPVFVDSTQAWTPQSNLVWHGGFGVQSTTFTGNFGFMFAGTNIPTFQVSTTAGSGPTATLPALINFMPNSSIAGSSGGFNIGNVAAYNPFLGQIRRLRINIRLTQTTSMRMWLGLGTSSGIAPGTYRSNAPVAAFAGFRYSTNAGDTKWQCVTQTDNLHQTVTAETGSHLNTSFHVFEIQYDGTNVLFLIDDVKVGSQSANAPTATQLTLLCFIDNVGLVGQPAADVAWCVAEGRF